MCQMTIWKIRGIKIVMIKFVYVLTIRIVANKHIDVAHASFINVVFLKLKT